MIDDISENESFSGRESDLESRSETQSYASSSKRSNASFRSRSSRSAKESRLKLGKVCAVENVKLRSEVAVLREEVNTLRQLLNDANSTLSMWMQSSARPPAGPSYNMSGFNQGIHSLPSNYTMYSRTVYNPENTQVPTTYHYGPDCPR